LEGVHAVDVGGDRDHGHNAAAQSGGDRVQAVVADDDSRSPFVRFRPDGWLKVNYADVATLHRSEAIGGGGVPEGGIVALFPGGQRILVCTAEPEASEDAHGLVEGSGARGQPLFFCIGIKEVHVGLGKAYTSFIRTSYL
jgi:hypothetical protein